MLAFDQIQINVNYNWKLPVSNYNTRNRKNIFGTMRNVLIYMFIVCLNYNKVTKNNELF